MFWLPWVALAIEPGRTEMLVERLTEEMHWFAATAMDVERISCTVGVPVDRTGDLYVGCMFPGGRIADQDVPKGLGWAAAAARDGVRRDSERRVTDIRLAYVATERRAWVCDHALLPNLLWAQGRGVVGLRGQEAHVAVGGDFSGAGESVRGCQGRPIAWTAPEALQGTSVLSAAVFGNDPAAKAALDDLLRAFPGLVADLGPPPSGAPQRGDTAPIYLVSDPAGLPTPGGAEGWVYVPGEPSRIIGSRLTWWLVADGTASWAGETVISGLPRPGGGVVGPLVPSGQSLLATFEAFATDVPVTPEWTSEARGFERLATWTLIYRP